MITHFFVGGGGGGRGKGKGANKVLYGSCASGEQQTQQALRLVYQLMNDVCAKKGAHISPEWN